MPQSPQSSGARSHHHADLNSGSRTWTSSEAAARPGAVAVTVALGNPEDEGGDQEAQLEEVRGGADPDWLQEETEVRERGGAAVAEKVALSLNGGGGEEKPPCADFRKGRCRRGDGCKYSHAVVK